MIRLFTVLGIICCSCVGNSSEKSQNSTLPTDTLKYSLQHMKEVSHFVIENNDNLDTTFYQISYPLFDQENFNQLIRDGILLEGEETPIQAAQAFIDGYNEFVEESSTTTINSAWYKDVQSTILNITPRLVSLQTSVSEYSGGAHGQHYTILNNYDVSTSKKIGLDDIIDSNKFSELTKIAEQIFRKQENLSDTASLEQDFFFDDGIFALNDNFGLTKDKLLFWYNEYEIRPYVFGSTTIEIPYDSIQHILTNQGKEFIQSVK